MAPVAVDRDTVVDACGGVGGDLVADAVVVVQLAVAAPVDGDVELAARVVDGESATQQIEEEPGPQVAVGAAGQRFTDGVHQRRSAARLRGEDLLTRLDVRGGELARRCRSGSVPHRRS